MKDTRKIVYLPPGIYGVTMLELMYPSSEFRIIVRDLPKKKKKRKTRR